MPIFYTYLPTPIGPLTATCTDTALTGLSFEKTVPADAHYAPQHPILQQLNRQLHLYFDGKLRQFCLPLAPTGTDFQRRVWRQLCQIPYGQTRTYGQLATAVGNPRASRAVGGANHHNPIVIVIPCHRVVAQNGIGGYGGGVDKKRFLLHLEQHFFEN